MNKLLCISLLTVLFFSCEKEKEPQFYHSRLYPVIKEQNLWGKNVIFKNIPISIRLESRIDYEDLVHEGRFEPISIEKAILSLDKDIYSNSDTIRKNTNLLNYNIAEIETYKVEQSGGFIDDSYILWINKGNLQNFSINKGYYTLYFSTQTKNNYIINDSTIIKIE